MFPYLGEFDRLEKQINLEGNSSLFLKEKSIIQCFELFPKLVKFAILNIEAIQNIEAEIKKDIQEKFYRFYMKLAVLLILFETLNLFELEDDDILFEVKKYGFFPISSDFQEVLPEARKTYALWKFIQVIHLAHPRKLTKKQNLTPEGVWLTLMLFDLLKNIEDFGLTGNPMLDNSGMRILSKTKWTQQQRELYNKIKGVIDGDLCFEDVAGYIKKKPIYMSEQLLIDVVKYINETSNEVVENAAKEYLNVLRKQLQLIAKGSDAKMYQLAALNSPRELIITGYGRRIPIFKGFN